MTQRTYDRFIKELRAKGYTPKRTENPCVTEWVSVIWHKGRYCLLRWSIHDLRGSGTTFFSEMCPYTLNFAADIPSLSESLELRGEGKSVQAAETLAQAFLEFAAMGYESL